MKTKSQHRMLALTSLLTLTLFATAGCQEPDKSGEIKAAPDPASAKAPVETPAPTCPAYPSILYKSAPATTLANDHLALLAKGQSTCDTPALTNYTCSFSKQERMGGFLKDQQVVDVKFREKPFSVAMAWTKNAPLADRLIYVEGLYKDADGKSQMLVRPKGGFAQLLAGKSVLRAPDGKDAMRQTLKPCTQFGFRNMLTALVDVYQQAEKAGDLQQFTAEMPIGIGERECTLLIRVLTDEGGKKNYPAYITEICLDNETHLPLRVTGYDKKGRLLCDYKYQNLKLNPGLADKDFTPQANRIEPPKKK